MGEGIAAIAQKFCTKALLIYHTKCITESNTSVMIGLGSTVRFTTKHRTHNGGDS